MGEEFFHKVPTDLIYNVPACVLGGFIESSLRNQAILRILYAFFQKKPCEYIINGISGYFVKELFTNEVSSLL